MNGTKKETNGLKKTEEGKPTDNVTSNVHVARPIPCSAVFILNENNELLTGYRPVEDIRCIPGGKVELGQTAVEAAIAEVREETGLRVEITQFLTYKDDLLPTGHFITLYFQAKVIGGTLQVLEPTKINDLKWTKLSDITNLFTGCQVVIPLLKT